MGHPCYYQKSALVRDEDGPRPTRTPPTKVPTTATPPIEPKSIEANNDSDINNALALPDDLKKQAEDVDKELSAGGPPTLGRGRGIRPDYIKAFGRPPSGFAVFLIRAIRLCNLRIFRNTAICKFIRYLCSQLK